MKKILKIVLIVVFLISLFFIELIRGSRIEFGMDTELPSNVMDY